MAKSFGKELKESEQLLEQLDKLAPELGKNLKAAFTEPLGAAAILLSLFFQAKQAIDDYNAELDKVSAAEMEAHLQTIEQVQKSREAATESAARYRAEVATAGDGEDPTRRQIDDARALAEAEAGASERIIKALGDVELARLRASGADSGAIATAERRIQAAVDQQQQAQDQIGFQSMESELRQRTVQQGALDKQAEAAIADAQQKGDSKRRVQGQLEDAQKAALPGGPLEQARQAAADKLAAANALPDLIPARPGYDTYQGNAANKNAAMTEANEAVQKAAADAEQNRRQVETLKRQLAVADYEAAKAKSAADKASASGIANAGRVADLPGEIDEAKKIYSNKRAADFAGRVAGALSADGELTTVQEAVQALKDQQELGRQLAQMIKEAAASHSPLLQLLQKEFQDIRDANTNLMHQIQNGATKNGTAL